MAAITTEVLDNVLWVTGHVDRSSGAELRTSLEEYSKSADMTDVPYFASGAAKELIGVAQDIEAKGVKLKVLSSKPVAQTLNLLGAKTWLEIEVALRPNTKPGAEPKLVKGAMAHSAARLKPQSGVRKAAGAPIHEGSVASYRPSLHLTSGGTAAKRESTPATAQPAAAPAASPGPASFSGKRQGPREDLDMDEAIQREGQKLVGDDIALADGLELLREMVILETYTFHFSGGDSSLTGKPLKHICGHWILTDSKGSRRMVNLQNVTFIDRLS